MGDWPGPGADRQGLRVGPWHALPPSPGPGWQCSARHALNRRSLGLRVLPWPVCPDFTRRQYVAQWAAALPARRGSPVRAGPAAGPENGCPLIVKYSDNLNIIQDSPMKETTVNLSWKWMFLFFLSLFERLAKTRCQSLPLLQSSQELIYGTVQWQQTGLFYLWK